MSEQLKLVSYWKETKEIYKEDEFTLIIGFYNHKNNETDEKALGVHWGNYPTSHNILTPCRIPKETGIAMLSGLLQKAAINKNTEQIKSIIEAIEFFQ
ncbi:hypothetical protein [Aliarcobacter butzleri]|uniref:hypothetical protein n=1 Tax=Aliarcobacter butzleri TaxID=28197 RepID=UPI003AF4FA54